MAVEIKVPALGESVTEATVSKWLVKAGDSVAVGGCESLEHGVEPLVRALAHPGAQLLARGQQTQNDLAAVGCVCRPGYQFVPNQLINQA